MSTIPYRTPAGELREIHLADIFDVMLTKAAPEAARRLFETLRTLPPEEVAELLNLRADGGLPANYFNIARGPNQKGAISYVPAAKVQPTHEDNWLKAVRQVAKPGKWLHTIFRDQALAMYGLNDMVIEALSGLVAAYAENKTPVILVPSNEIREWYCTKRVRKGNNKYHYGAPVEATAFMSCQHWTDDVKQANSPKTFDFYDALAPSGNLRLAIVLDETGLLVARSLVWRTEAISYKGGTYAYYSQKRTPETDHRYYPELFVMDYPYAAGSDSREALNKYGRDRGWAVYNRGYNIEMPKGDDNTELNFRVATGFTKKCGIDRPYLDSTVYEDTKDTKGYIYASRVRDWKEFDAKCAEFAAQAQATQVLPEPLVQVPLPFQAEEVPEAVPAVA